MSKRAFIVFGHNRVIFQQVVDCLNNRNFESVFIDDEDKITETIIETIETKLQSCQFAVCIWTPDDVGGKRGEDLPLSPRARQNVVFETGLVMAKLGRKSVAVIKCGQVELPSDLNGPWTIRSEATMFTNREALQQVLKKWA